ncbi:MAG TPA: tetratricopeptide repeat protein, partial [Rheinheimera sp.]|nr:tetratricopeptide repeat protein [Rheinheimera sp.]
GLARALELNHNGKIIVGYGNLARTQQLLGQYQQAYDNYELSLGYMTEGNDDVTRAIHLLRMAEICWQRGDVTKAAMLMGQINHPLLSEFHLTTFDMLQTQLGIASR